MLEGERVDVDPRILRTRRIVREAVLEELAAVGVGSFAVEAVAARAGVGKSTIYRHWRDRTELIIDALENLNIQPEPETAGTPRDRIEKLLTHLVEVMADPVIGACAVALIEAAERDPRIAELHHRYSEARLRGLQEAIVEGAGAGSFPPGLDADLASWALAGAIIYRRVMSEEAIGTEDVPRLVSLILGPP